MGWTTNSYLWKPPAIESGDQTNFLTGFDNVDTALDSLYTPSITTISSSSTPTPAIPDGRPFNYIVSALAEAAIFGAPTGSPMDGQRMMIAIKDDGSARSLSWNEIYIPIGISLPGITSPGKWTYVGMQYSTVDSTWHVLASAQQS